MIGAQEVDELALLFGRVLGPDLHPFGWVSGVDPHRLSFLDWVEVVEEVGLLQFGTAGVDEFLSCGSSDELMTVVASS